MSRAADASARASATFFSRPARTSSAGRAADADFGGAAAEDDEVAAGNAGAAGLRTKSSAVAPTA
ncbi:MAG: hypothetical protein FJ137_19465 [Deltaproteobacteria bacterium]|nr:hypothetical protein [Deltaproteobacteria bacterium]